MGDNDADAVNAENDERAGLTGRRQAMKVGAAAVGGAAAAWAIPTISGVGITPADAAIACSANSVHRTVLADTSWPPASPPATMQFSFNVNSDSGGCTDPAAWTGAAGAGAFTVFPGTYYAQQITISARGPIGNVDNPCGQTVAAVTGVTFPGGTDATSPFEYTITRDHIPVGKNGTSCALAPADVQTRTYTLNCGVSMHVNSCPPAGIANSNACMMFGQAAGAGGCSAALNGSASGTVTITCTSS